ncbi:ATP F0F1 synthase subunit I [[Haemophilus] felis]|uniref:F0F1 ATP synthase subunit I n=1 Tax=[Haemophilus] felis TaxID=123822 RepID=A0A1T0B058_9PAST|nr:ATP F0F1 synthase subunit I [[Haemophilus] felis]NBI40080.1 ATP F0F1 synthase subunit I [[Haemophilus] felis]NBI43036.1 ATP F0F1 synthase subunit I [[Haemophilus] felis]OOS03454.1 hypothetical protein B0188_06320 [[Haemophilus] felis]
MSKVLLQSINLYKKTLFLESCCLLLISLALGYSDWKFSLYFLCGAIAVFLPFCIFIFLVFFRQKKDFSNNIKHFYRGEMFKFLATILLCIVFFVVLPSVNYLIFFLGYSVALLFNTVIPLLLSRTKFVNSSL